MQPLTTKLFDGILGWAAETLPCEVSVGKTLTVAGICILLGSAIAWLMQGPVLLGAACGCFAGLASLWLIRRLAAHAAAYADPPRELRQRLQRARRRGQWAEARRLGQQLLQSQREAGDQAGMARELRALGILAQREGDWAEARRLYSQSLDISRELGDQSGMAQGLGHIAFVARLQGDLLEARRAYEEKLRIAMHTRDEDGVVFALVQLALIARDRHDDTWAGELAEALLEIGQQLGNQCALWEGLRLSSALAEHQGDYAEAHRLSEQSGEAFRRMLQAEAN